MKLPALLCLIAFPTFSHAEEKDDGDWEFLKSSLPNRIAAGAPVVDREITDSFRFLPAALKFIGEAKKLTVFEGMPHQNFESELLKSEQDKIEETIIGGFPFYPQPRDFQEKDEPALREILRLPSCFRPFLYLKMCGGFHPDYVIRFSKGEEHCDLLLCFGCGDARILHDGKVIHCHIFKKAWKELLAGYAKQRPKPMESAE
jgi:hypothetical protein